MVTEEDFIVNDSEEEYETASSNDESDSQTDAAEVDEHWAQWGEEADVDGKLRKIVRDTGKTVLLFSIFQLLDKSESPGTS